MPRPIMGGDYPERPICLHDEQQTESVSVIDTSTNTAVRTVTMKGCVPWGVAITPNGTDAYVTCPPKVSVIDTVSNRIVKTITVGHGPTGVAITPDGSHAYVVKNSSSNLLVIDIATNTVVKTLSVGKYPVTVAIN